MQSSAWTPSLVTVISILSFIHGASRAEALCSPTVSNRTFVECKDLPALGATYAWTLHNDTNTIDFAFEEDMLYSTGWVAWGINPDGITMPGTQALAAFRDGASVIVKKYDVSKAVRDNGQTLAPGPISVNYTTFSAEIVSTMVTIFGTLQLAPGQSFVLNHIWQRGPTVDLTTFVLSQHDLGPQNFQSVVVIDMSTAAAQSVGLPYIRLKRIHGALNAVSWGILLPIGVMAARYLRPFAIADPLWFYIHISCQLLGYAIGVVGFCLGMRLQNVASTIQYRHRNLGIFIFSLASLQIMSIVLRPKKDSKVRKYWNVYHHTIGYATIILIIANIFEGLKLLEELESVSPWNGAYLAVLVIFGVVSVVAEGVTWFLWFQRRQQLDPQRLDGTDNVPYASSNNNSNNNVLNKIESANKSDQPDMMQP